MSDTHVYRFTEAPEYYRKMSNHHGDEDYVVVLTSVERSLENWPFYFANRKDDDYLEEWGHADWHYLYDEDITVVIFAHA